MIAGDGVYSRRTPTGGIELTNVNLDTTRMLVEGESILDVSSGNLYINL